MASASQSVSDSRSARGTSRSAVRLVPEPPPNTDTFATLRRNTSAITHVPIAKYPPSRRNATSDTGIATTVAIPAASGTAMNGDTPQ